MNNSPPTFGANAGNSQCIEQIAENTYRCKNTGVVIKATVLPIRCGFCDKAIPTKEFPSLIQQAKNFAGAVVEHARGGFQRTSEEEIKQRISICNECEFFAKDSGRCRQCGCFLINGILGTEGKIFWKGEKCPIGKW